MARNAGNVARLGLGLIAGATLLGCDRRVEPDLPATRYELLDSADVPDFLQGTVLEQVVVFGTEPQVISGFGLVVNLDNTGRDDGIPTRVRERILLDAARLGVSMPRTDGTLGEVSPSGILADPRTTVVRVDGVVPPGSKPDSRIDVAVSALDTNTSPSLARGELWLTELYRGGVSAGNPGEQVNRVGVARGPLMLNPSAALLDPRSAGDVATARGDLRNAIIPDGGRSDLDRPIVLRMRRPDPRLVRLIEDRINFHFGRVGGVAKARDEAVIELRLPTSGPYASTAPDAWRNFVGVATHLYLRGGNTAFAVNKARQLEEAARAADGDGEILRHVTLAWQGLGADALPVVAPLIADDDPHVRFHAARAAAALQQRAALEVLGQIAGDANDPYNVAAAESLGDFAPTVAARRLARDLLSESRSGNDQVRIAAYESLLKLGFSQTGIVEKFVGQRFVLHLTPGDGQPIVYAKRTGRPTIAVIGALRPMAEVPRIRPDTLMTAFGDRVSLVRQENDDAVTLFQRDIIAGDSDARPEGFSQVVSLPDLREILLRLGGESRPGERPLRLSYGDVVAILTGLGEAGDIVAGPGQGQPVLVRLEPREVIDSDQDVVPLVPGLTRNPAEISASVDDVTVPAP
ncbi:MAG: flagellar basal body P-ring protein FlgI [Planctomycetota bacterium]